jgi:hypothetical protein
MGKNYLVVGRLAWKNALIIEKVFLYRPWRKELQNKLEAAIKSCPSVSSYMIQARIKAFGRV